MLYSKIEGAGKPLLILHGFLGMSDNWNTLAGRYAENGFQVHSLDLRNHGRSFHSEDFTYDAMSADVLEYCRSKQLADIFVIGHSMGGKVAMHLAAKNPELVQKLLVADIGPQYYPPHHQELLDALCSVDLSAKPDRSDVDDMLKNKIKDFGTRQFLLKSLYWKSPGQLGWRFNLDVFKEQLDNVGRALPEDLRYEKPVLFLKGKNSGYIREQDEALIKKHFPNSEIQSVSKAGHWLHAENPDEFLEKSLAFFK